MKNKSTKFVIPSDDRALLQEMAKRARMSEAEVIRRLIRKGAGDMRITLPLAPVAQVGAATPPATMAAEAQPSTA